MNRKLIFGLVILSLLVLISCLNIVSASLCLGNDRYYHNCDDDRYFDDRYNNYNNYYYYHGNYYPTRDDYYREYYRPRYYDSKYNDDRGLTYKDNEEYKRTIEYQYEDRGVSEKIKKTITEKTEINLNYDIPYLINAGYYNNQNYNNANTGNWYDLLYDVEPVPYSTGWYEKNKGN